jgi:hypothetical protein
MECFAVQKEKSRATRMNKKWAENMLALLFYR